MGSATVKQTAGEVHLDGNQDSLCLFLPVRDCIDRPSDVSDPGPDMLKVVDFECVMVCDTSGCVQSKYVVLAESAKKKVLADANCKSHRGD